jgi:Ni/Fe-hydrogenase subunit HybB-like protein
MSNRFGTGYERYDYYSITKSFNYMTPHLGEILVVIGSIGVAIMIYKLFDSLFSVGDLREHH